MSTRRQSALNEQQLLAAVARGDSTSLGELFDQYGAIVNTHLITAGTSPQAAEQILFRAFRALWVIAPRLRADASALHHLLQLADLHRPDTDLVAA